MPVPTLYLDTSVIGGYYDDEWMDATRELWRLRDAGRFRFVTSIVTEDELDEAPDQVRNLFLQTFTHAEDILLPTDSMEELALAYISSAVLPPKFTDDARHVAICTVSRFDYLVSWNFKHLVNVNRSAAFNAVNLLQGYPPVRIVNPLELIYDHDAKDL